MANHPHDRLEAFIKKVDKRSHDECWPWLASKNNKGYGEFWDGNSKGTYLPRDNNHISVDKINIDTNGGD